MTTIELIVALKKVNEVITVSCCRKKSYITLKLLKKRRKHSGKTC